MPAAPSGRRPHAGHTARNMAMTGKPVTGASLAPLVLMTAPDTALASPHERPRERLWRRGTAAIGDAELIAMVLGTGVRDHPATEVAAALLRTAGGVVALARASPRELAQITGVGIALATRIAAAFELGRRALE